MFNIAYNNINTDTNISNKHRKNNIHDRNLAVLNNVYKSVSSDNIINSHFHLMNNELKFLNKGAQIPRGEISAQDKWYGGDRRTDPRSKAEYKDKTATRNAVNISKEDKKNSRKDKKVKINFMSVNSNNIGRKQDEDIKQSIGSLMNKENNLGNVNSKSIRINSNKLQMQNEAQKLYPVNKNNRRYTPQATKVNKYNPSLLMDRWRKNPMNTKNRATIFLPKYLENGFRKERKYNGAYNTNYVNLYSQDRKRHAVEPFISTDDAIPNKMGSIYKKMKRKSNNDDSGEEIRINQRPYAVFYNTNAENINDQLDDKGGFVADGSFETSNIDSPKTKRYTNSRLHPSVHHNQKIIN